ncbi:uncharacterized protein [Haliotis cracherodii]|uniref:uncharacterized protein n=1 Tax=Haliotis cracherodii TaxID=6455 RepID=UPI0039EC7D1D
MAGLRNVEYIMSQRGTPQILLDGYLYNRNRERQTSTHWRCVIKTCTGRCTTSDDFLRNQTEHNHPPEHVNKHKQHGYQLGGRWFPLPLWNHHETEGPRIKNSLEGFHCRLNQSLPRRHPNIFRFIEVTRRIEHAERSRLVQVNFEAAPPSRKRVYREIDNRIIRLKDHLRLGQKTPVQFLDAVGHLLKLA